MTTRQPIWPLAIPFVLLGVLVFAALTPALVQQNWMAEALSIDLMLTIPLAWFLVIRKRPIPNITVVPFSVACMIIGYQTIPEGNQQILFNYKTFILPFIELGVIGFIIYKVVQLRKRAKQLSDANTDFFDIMSQVIKEVVPGKVSSFLALEVSMFYFAFNFSKAKKLEEGQFSYHKESGTQALYGAVVFIILVETVALHFLISGWSEVTAWVLTGLSIYTAIQFLAFTRSMGKRPMEVDNHEFRFRLGTFAQGSIPLDKIVKAYKHTSDLPEDKSVAKLGLLGELESHNIILEFSESISFARLYGKKSYSKIAFWSDSPDDLISTIQDYQSQ